MIDRFLRNRMEDGTAILTICVIGCVAFFPTLSTFLLGALLGALGGSFACVFVFFQGTHRFAQLAADMGWTQSLLSYLIKPSQREPETPRAATEPKVSPPEPSTPPEPLKESYEVYQKRYYDKLMSYLESVKTTHNVSDWIDFDNTMCHLSSPALRVAENIIEANIVRHNSHGEPKCNGCETALAYVRRQLGSRNVACGTNSNI